MTLFVRLADVPSEILELVKARILANRKRNRQKPPAVLPSSQTPRRRYYNPQAADRRPEPGAVHVPQLGATGMAWVATPYKRGYFNGVWFYSFDIYGNKDDYVVDENDLYHFKVGSGDGSTWVTATLSLPGVNAYRDSWQSFFSPRYNDGFVGYYSFYRTDPTGKILSEPYNNYKNDDSRVHTMTLPCGNGSAIVLVMARASAAWRATKLVCTSAQSFVWEGQTVWQVSSQEVVTSDAHTLVTSDVAAFFVSQDKCRLINVPATLRARLDDLLLSGEWGGSIPWYPYGPNLPDLFPTTVPVPQASSPYYFTSPYYPDWAGNIQVNGHYRMYESLISTPLYNSYGANSAVMQIPGRWHMITPSTTTPAIYLGIVNPQALFDSVAFPYEEDENYSYVQGRERLRALGAPAPTHVVGFDARKDDYKAVNDAIYADAFPYYGSWEASIYRDPGRMLEGISIVRSGRQPANYYDYLPQDQGWQEVKRLPLAADRTLPYDTPPDGNGSPRWDNYRMLWHYDWGEPAYCRQQLLALGFSPADLTP